MFDKSISGSGQLRLLGATMASASRCRAGGVLKLTDAIEHARRWHVENHRDVLPIAEVLALTKIRTHEELFDKLVAWSPGMGDCVFISQTWLGKTHPDPAGSKLQLLQQVRAQDARVR